MNWQNIDNLITALTNVVLCVGIPGIILFLIGPALIDAFKDAEEGWKEIFHDPKNRL